MLKNKEEFQSPVHSTQKCSQNKRNNFNIFIIDFNCSSELFIEFLLLLIHSISKNNKILIVFYYKIVKLLEMPTNNFLLFKFLLFQTFYNFFFYFPKYLILYPFVIFFSLLTDKFKNFILSNIILVL